MNLCAAVLVREVQGVAHIRRAECIERLIVVGYHPQIEPSLHEAIDQLDLPWVDVLIFIDKEMIVSACDCRGIGGVLNHCADHQRHHVGKIDSAGALKGALVDSEEIHGINECLVILVDVAGEALRVQKTLLGAGNNVQYVNVLVPPHPPRGEHVPLLRRIPELEILAKSCELRAPSKMPKRKAVKR